MKRNPSLLVRHRGQVFSDGCYKKFVLDGANTRIYRRRIDSGSHDLVNIGAAQEVSAPESVFIRTRYGKLLHDAHIGALRNDKTSREVSAPKVDGIRGHYRSSGGNVGWIIRFQFCR
jgi:hypothetical protein